MDLREMGWGMLSGSSWLRIGTGDGLLWIRWWTFGFWRHGVSSLPKPPADRRGAQAVCGPQFEKHWPTLCLEILQTKNYVYANHIFVWSNFCNINVTAFWDTAPCSLVDWRFRHTSSSTVHITSENTIRWQHGYAVSHNREKYYAPLCMKRLHANVFTSQDWLTRELQMSSSPSPSQTSSIVSSNYACVNRRRASPPG
jgi:hypothetical protein